jgi:hypothetical protein
MRKTFFFVFLIAFPLLAFSQQLDVNLLQEEKINFQQNGMLVLGGWAVANMAGSGYMMTRTSGWQYRFHQMNVFWNVVNLGIASGGYFGQSEATTDAFGLYKDYADFGKILLVNAGLDVAYIATGFYLQERAKNVNKRSDMFKGYGKSVVLQGSFLLLFDAALYWINQSKMNSIFEAHDFSLAFSGQAFQFTYFF